MNGVTTHHLQRLRNRRAVPLTLALASDVALGLSERRQESVIDSRIRQLNRTMRNGLKFVRNVLRWSIRDRSLSSIRPRHVTPRPLDTDRVDGIGPVTITAVGVGVPIFIVFILGGQLQSSS